MNLAPVLLAQDLQLGRLTAPRLAKVLHGIMSVGTASLEMENPADFLAERGRMPLGFLEVLRSLGTEAGHWDAIGILRRAVEELAAKVKTFHGTFLRLAQWRDMGPDDLRETAALLSGSYAACLADLASFCELLGLSDDYSTQVRDDTLLLNAWVQEHLARLSRGGASAEEEKSAPSDPALAGAEVRP